MKNIKYYLLLFVCIACAQNKRDNTNADAKKIYESHLQKVQEFVDKIEHEGEFSGDTKVLNEAIIFLERITEIEAEVLESYDYNFIPSMENYRDWKEWFKLNSKKLFLDDGVVKVKPKD